MKESNVLIAKATLSDDRPLYLIGLSQSNLDKLAEHQPILIDLRKMGGTGEVWLAYGRSEAELLESLSEFIGPQTVMRGIGGQVGAEWDGL